MTLTMVSWDATRGYPPKTMLKYNPLFSGSAPASTVQISHPFFFASLTGLVVGQSMFYVNGLQQVVHSHMELGLRIIGVLGLKPL